MNNQEYEQKRRECWEEFCRMNPSHNKSIFAKKTLEFAFDRAYTLGKQNVSAKPKSIQLSDVKQKIDAWIENHTDEEVYECLKKYGAVEDVDTVIQGWVARDKNGDLVCCVGSKPYKEENIPFWKVNFRNFFECIPNDLFPDLTWDDDPIEVELIIKRKKK